MSQCKEYRQVRILYLTFISKYLTQILVLSNKYFNYLSTRLQFLFNENIGNYTFWSSGISIAYSFGIW